MSGGEAQGDEAAERDAADDGALDLVLVERAQDLIRVVVDRPGAAERERHHVEVARQRRDRRAHVRPVALDAGDEHERRTMLGGQDWLISQISRWASTVVVPVTAGRSTAVFGPRQRRGPVLISNR